jgi:hypothetical protein
MPKKARFIRTNSVKGGPRSKGGGTRNNGPNCGVIAIYGPGLLAGLAVAARLKGWA